MNATGNNVMEVCVLGTGCAKCKKLLEEAQKAVAQAGHPVALIKVEKLDEIISFGVLATPALVVAGEVKCSGRIPASAEIVGWILSALATG